ncbi:sensor histidine kinase [Nocardioides marmotae]|uniref:histidine kinase n=1 Tax=Nocardioides marmotae TaxID=2663857 RepID=A0A6I3JB03_9ACTN|nr:PAS domain-containing sensor histidine kinase [Nocardioides marmotae]MCR6031630.1 PAS domain-containing protein [Gordonia jinghuaiqii]MBC9733212.1 histidine kinase N-terminal domain-containing protein [Nocardioides marmotae]MTB84323.1 PAS domain-containing protein [Nocardioides marmotae]MTB95269.1 PAS domain-containing protein [Nocardioides marmotae]QKE02261.1 PAS domain-containing protein [Nocardioides marmotae]
MPTLADLVRSHTDLSEEDVAWLQLLQADWQIIADLSFADLVLWLPDRAGSGFWAAGQMRPTTGPTAYVDDVVGTFVPAGRRPLLDTAYAEGRLVREGDPEWRDDVPVRVETIPVRRAGRVIAVVARNTNLLGVRTPSRLELSYLQTAADLTQMIAQGWFPATGQRSDHADSPRVGDGFLRVDARGRVAYASPNALSVYRRLGLSGDLAGLSLADLTRELVPPRRRPDEETLSAVLGGRAHRDTEIGTDTVSLIVRSIPLRPQGTHIGALVLVRDVTDLRRRDRELVTKDATIREIHHRVKNNLQTVAALLRLQARRIDSEAAKLALEEAVRRVGSIAIVHETLSQAVEETVDFDEIADRLGSMVTEVSAVAGRVRMVRDGGFGTLPSESATALAMVLTELLQNAVEHGYEVDARAEPAVPEDLSALGEDEGPGGTIRMTVRRGEGRLRLTVDDDGRGLPEGFDLDGSTNLGLSIVRTLVESELGGRLELGPVPAGPGTRASVDVPLA